MDFLAFAINISWLAALCFVAGFILIIIEMHIPGFGVAGVMGIIFFIVGIILAANSFLGALILILIVLSILGCTFIIFLNMAKNGKFNKTLILTSSLNKEEGYIGVEDLAYFINKEGIAVTKLRPSGTADFDGVKLDVVSEGVFIEAGTPVRIVSVQGRRIVVKPLQ